MIGEYVIFLNGVYADDKSSIKKLCDNKKIIAADGGANFCYELSIIPDYIIGDLDSLKDEILQYFKKKGSIIIKTDKDKDYTDFELCLKFIENSSFDDIKTRFKKDKISILKGDSNILVLGATGKRVDMTLSNLKKLHNHKNMYFISENFETIKYIKLEKERYELKNLKDKTFSILAITDIEELTLEGFEYNLYKKNIDKSISLASNIVRDDMAYIECLKGEMYIIYE